MAVTPTKLSAAQVSDQLFTEPPRDFGFLLTEANLYRSRDTITLVQSDDLWQPGQFITAAGALATAPGQIAGILGTGTNTRMGARAGVAIVRDAEVTDAYLHFGDMDPAAVATQLASLGIIMRQAVLPNVAAGSFDPNQTGDIQSGIKPMPPPEPPEELTYPQAGSFAPSTLEAAEPDKKAAGSPQPAPEEPAAGSTTQPPGGA